ncbi:hypothetical protein BC835DRAFT_1417677 [Cytidiella melzeri]|nr:hypothetical protein BC835DRAFT_1417677 [Cytidiella melzeri]
MSTCTNPLTSNSVPLQSHSGADSFGGVASLPKEPTPNKSALSSGFSRDHFFSVRVPSSPEAPQQSSQTVTEHCKDLDGTTHSFTTCFLRPYNSDIPVLSSALSVKSKMPIDVPLDHSQMETSSSSFSSWLARQVSDDEWLAGGALLLTVDSAWNLADEALLHITE